MAAANQPPVTTIAMQADPSGATPCGNPQCINAGLKRCSRCRAIRYCSQSCQRLHWPHHKSACAALHDAGHTSQLTNVTPPTSTLSTDDHDMMEGGKFMIAGESFMADEKYAEALDYFQKSASVSKRRDDKAMYAAALGGCGNCYEGLGKEKEMVAAFKEAAEVAVSCEAPTIAVVAHHALARHWLRKENAEEALAELQKAEPLLVDPSYKATQYTLMIQVYELKKDPDQVRHYTDMHANAEEEKRAKEISEATLGANSATPTVP